MSGEVAKQDVLPARTSAPLTPARVATGHAHPAEPRTGPESVLALQRMAGNRATSRAIRSQPPQEGVVPEGAGAPLGDDLREDMERRFDGDFADVRVHTGATAARSASALSAKAFTVGRDIVFSDGRFAPQSSAGKHLLAHELAHVVQQSRGGAPPAFSGSSGGLERAANQSAAQAVQSDGAIGVAGASSIGVARAPEDDEKNKSLTGRAFGFLSRNAPGLAKAAQSAVPIAETVEATLSPKSKEQVGRALDYLEKKEAEGPPDLSKATWLGTPPLEVRQKQAAAQRQRDEEARRDNPVGIGDPAPKPGAADARDLPPGNMFAPEPDPTPFESQLRSGKTFAHTLPPAKPDIDPRDATWIGPRPSDATLRQTQFRAAGELPPSTKIFIPGDAKFETQIDPQEVWPVRDPKTGELKGYSIRRGETVWQVDRNGNTLDTRNLEPALEEPAVDPIDVLMLGVDVGPLLAKGLTSGGKAIARKLVTKSAVRGTTEAATEEATSLGAKKATQKAGSEALGSKPASDVGAEAIDALKASGPGGSASGATGDAAELGSEGASKLGTQDAAKAIEPPKPSTASAADAQAYTPASHQLGPSSLKPRETPTGKPGGSRGEVAEPDLIQRFHPNAEQVPPGQPGFDAVEGAELRSVNRYWDKRSGTLVTDEHLHGGNWIQFKTVTSPTPQNVAQNVEHALERASNALKLLRQPKIAESAPGIGRRMIPMAPERITIHLALENNAVTKELLDAARQMVKDLNYGSDLPPVHIVITGQ